jgi:DNA-binding NarL/FixJ family response regulator
MSTPLSSLLSEYAVPLRVWLGPVARRIAADTLIDTLGHLAEVHTDPIHEAAQLVGPAVLVVAADDLSGTHREALRDLAERASPGRVVLIGGTSDRDVLMDAINTWRAIRVVPATAPGAEIVDAVRSAGDALRAAVALSTAIDDLDIENTMLDSAISQMKEGHQRARKAAKDAAISTMSQGLAQTMQREKSAIENLAQDHASLGQALRGVHTITDLLGRISTRSQERNAGMPTTPDSVDAMVAAAADLGGSGPGPAVSVDASSGAMSTLNPYALIHLLTHIIRSSRSSGEVQLSCTRDNDSVRIMVNGAVPDISTAEGPVAQSVRVLREEGALFEASGGSITLVLPSVQAD